MPAYCSATDVAQLGVSEAVSGALDPAVVTATIEAQSAHADGYLHAYGAPLSAWGQDLRRVVAVLSAYDLVTVHSRIDADDPTAAIWAERARAAEQWLRDVAKGIVVPVGLTPQTPGAITTGALDVPVVYTRPRR